MPVHMYRDMDQKGLTAIGGLQVSHQRLILGIHCIQVASQSSKESTLTQTDITRNTQHGCQWPKKKDVLQ